jgi:transcriptional regulator with XRE-family HTH domain
MAVQVNGRLIKQLRIKHSYSQERLAEIAGVNLRTIQRIETNGAASLSTRGALASALGVQPEELDVPGPSAAGAAQAGEPVGRRPQWWLPTLSGVLVVLGGTVLAISIKSVTPIGLLTPPAVAGVLVALTGFVLLTRLTPLSRWRTYAVLCIVAVSMAASPPAWTVRSLVAILLWAAFEVGVLVTRLRPRKRLAAGPNVN